jgi:hypothetical protein
MRNRFRSILILAAVALLVGGATAARYAAFQRPDLASAVFPASTIVPGTPAAAANVLTGTMVDLANYASAALIISVGRAIDSVNNYRYVVLSDSAAGAAAAAYDSVLIDSTDNASYKLGYKGAKRWIRATVRAKVTGDTTWVAVSVLRGNARFRN